MQKDKGRGLLDILQQSEITHDKLSLSVIQTNVMQDLLTVEQRVL